MGKSDGKIARTDREEVGKGAVGERAESEQIPEHFCGAGQP